MTTADITQLPDGSCFWQLPHETDLLAIRETATSQFPYLLQTARAPLTQPGYDLLLGLPGQTLIKQFDGSLWLDRECLSGPRGFLQQLDSLFAQEAVSPQAAFETLPFIGGWFVFLGYEIAAEVEPVLTLPATPWQEPIAIATRCHGAVIRRHHDGQVMAFAEAGYQQAMREALDQAASQPLPPARAVRIAELKEDPPEQYRQAVKRIRDYIRDGDVFQVNISRRWQMDLADQSSATDVYRSLCRSNPAPFAAYCQLGPHHQVLSSSPERLLQRHGDRVETRPIAGTRPRGSNQDLDQKLSRELMINPKERAEHVMLIDLERNDLGRICEPGSVEVNEFMCIESYAHVHHIVSNVRGRLRADVTPGQALAAVFPGGTITGCPKVRCMEIIGELEQQGRGVYTGSLGYLGRDGRIDSNILIRSMVAHDGQLAFRTGGGIVYDSRPDPELAETRAKARGLLRALGLAD